MPTQDRIAEFVGAAHFNLARVKEMLAEEPELLTAPNDETNEDALGAAAHVGNREIVEYLLAQGAPTNICVEAMLGNREAVQEMLACDRKLADAGGAHGIPVLCHAAVSGDVTIAEVLAANGATEGITGALQMAVARGHTRMVEWSIAHGADVNAPNWEGRKPLEVALSGDNDEIAIVLRSHGAAV